MAGDASHPVIRCFSRVFPQRWGFFAPTPTAQLRTVFEFSSSKKLDISPIAVDVSEPLLKSRMRFRSVAETLADMAVTDSSMEFLDNFRRKNVDQRWEPGEQQRNLDRQAIARKKDYPSLVALLNYGISVRNKADLADEYDTIRLIIIACPVTDFESLRQEGPSKRIVDISKGSVVYDSSAIPIENL